MLQLHLIVYLSQRIGRALYSLHSTSHCAVQHLQARTRRRSRMLAGCCDRIGHSVAAHAVANQLRGALPPQLPSTCRFQISSHHPAQLLPSALSFTFLPYTCTCSPFDHLQTLPPLRTFWPLFWSHIQLPLFSFQPRFWTPISSLSLFLYIYKTVAL